MNATGSEIERFNTKWVLVGDCHVWQGPLDKDGYGTFFFRRLNRRAHRVAWFFLRGEVGKEFVINHTCRNRACVNVQHLQRVTPTENALKDSRSICYVNSQKTHCKKNHEFDKVRQKKGGGEERVCSICEAEKHRRLRAKWRKENALQV